jgi:photosystem II stability/assembly factor-like uncharacterized protein
LRCSASLIAAAAALACAGAARVPGPAEAQAPAWRLATTARHDHLVTTAGFLDERTGLTVGGAGAGNIAVVFTTADGGRTWVEAASPSWQRHALELLPGGFAWHAGVLTAQRSFDGGRTWYRAGSFGDGDPAPALFLSFADETRGLIGTTRRLGLSDDGGLRWRPVALPPGIEELAAVSMALAPPRPGENAPSLVALHTVPPVVGRVLDRAGGIWATRDGGASWVREESPLAGRPFWTAGGAPAAALRYTPAGAGVLAAFVEEDGRRRCRVWRTPGGGAGWAEAPIDLHEPGTLFVSFDGRVLTWKSLERSELRVYAWEERGTP